MKEMVYGYLTEKHIHMSSEKAKAILLCKQLGLNASKLDDEEWRVLMKVLGNTPLIKKGIRKK